METTSKPVRAIILDAGPIIKGEPAVSTLLGQCEELLTTTSVIDEIKDKATRTRLETILMPFLTMRSPKTSSVKFVSEFARKTGDFSVLSRTDIELLALAYEVECERNGGDWRLRKSPGQKRTNGPSPFKTGDQATEDAPAKDSPKETPGNVEAKPESAEIENFPPIPGPEEHLQDMPDMLDSGTAAQAVNPQSNPDPQDESGVGRENPPATEDDAPLEAALPDMDPNLASTDPETDEQDSDSDGWITPSNINRKQLEGASSSSSKAVEPKIMQVVRLPWPTRFASSLTTAGHNNYRFRDAKRLAANEPQPPLPQSAPGEGGEDLHTPMSRYAPHASSKSCH
jgi:RNA-binding protein NOB1